MTDRAWPHLRQHPRDGLELADLELPDIDPSEAARRLLVVLDELMVQVPSLALWDLLDGLDGWLRARAEQPAPQSSALREQLGEEIAGGQHDIARAELAGLIGDLAAHDRIIEIGRRALGQQDWD